MNVEFGHFPGDARIVSLPGKGGKIMSVDAEGKPKMFHLLSDKEIKRLSRREKALKVREGEAFQILKPLVAELATHGEESIDTPAHEVELRDAIGSKNYFLVKANGDYNEGMVKAMDYLLEKRSLIDIAGVLIPDNPDFKNQVRVARTSLVNLMKDKNPKRFLPNK
jgi:hypothetical protein